MKGVPVGGRGRGRGGGRAGGRAVTPTTCRGGTSTESGRNRATLRRHTPLQYDANGPFSFSLSLPPSLLPSLSPSLPPSFPPSLPHFLSPQHIAHLPPSTGREIDAEGAPQLANKDKFPMHAGKALPPFLPPSLPPFLSSPGTRSTLVVPHGIVTLPPSLPPSLPPPPSPPSLPPSLYQATWTQTASRHG
jgi:hypothetical protein